MIATRRVRCLPGGQHGDLLEAAEHVFSRRSLTSLCRSRSSPSHATYQPLAACGGDRLITVSSTPLCGFSPTRLVSSLPSTVCIGPKFASLPQHLQQQRRALSQIPRGGADLLGPEALAVGDNPDGLRKIVLDSYMPTGFDVMGMLDHAQDFDDDNDESLKKSPTLHMNGSMIAFPTSCFLWDVAGPKDVTLESLSLVLLREPSVEFLFIGCNHPLPPRELNKIRREMKERGIVVEQLDLVRDERRLRVGYSLCVCPFCRYIRMWNSINSSRDMLQYGKGCLSLSLHADRPSNLHIYIFLVLLHFLLCRQMRWEHSIF